MWLCNCGWFVCMPFLGVERNGTYRTYVMYKTYRMTSNWSQEVPLLKSRHVLSKHWVPKSACRVRSGVVSITFGNPRVRGTWELRQYGTEGGRPMSLVSLLPQGGNNFISGMLWRIIHTIQSFSICIFIKVINVMFYWIKLFYQIYYRNEQFPYLLIFHHWEWFPTLTTASPYLILNNTFILLLLAVSVLGIICWLSIMENREFNSFLFSFTFTRPSSFLILPLELYYNLAWLNI